ncbi:MAG: RNA polymerase sigma factor [Candidatus Limiplasma sp.]|nr:RNA polymerase sigma factor [Candidatus Limiplasma sp.]
MTQEEFANRIVAIQDTLYRVSTTLLPQLCDREDAVQEAIVKAWQKQSKLRDDRAMRAWVIRILINECHTLLRRRKREVPSDTLPERETAPDALPDLYQVFTSLEEKYRLPMVLYYVEGYSVEETARMLGLPQGTLKSRLYRGRLLLKDTLNMEEVRA